MNKSSSRTFLSFITVLMGILMSVVIHMAVPCDVQAFGSLTENGTAAFMGIGTTPQKILHVSGTGPGTVPLFQRNSDSAGFIIERTPTNRWVLGVNESPTLGNGFVLSTIPVGTTSVPRLMVTRDGNVGIGTTNPQAKLEVAGSVRISESINRRPTNIPLFRWLSPKVLATYNVAGPHPYAIAFDGTNMWTADFWGNSVTMITPTGNTTTYSGIGRGPTGIAFDGTNMWTANVNGDNVTKIGPAGTIIGTYGPTGHQPGAIAFDGTNMWTANNGDYSVTKIGPTGTIIGTYGPTGGQPYGIAFDGVNMWTTNSDDNSVTRISPAGVMENFTGTGNLPYGIAFDGVNMWTSNIDGNNVTKISPTGSIIGTYGTTGGGPYGIAFDGVNMWTANKSGNSVTKITPTGNITTYSGTGAGPIGIAFDGTNMWTANVDNNTVSKILVITK